ncbi:hypothetical protein SDC9_179267 [bioreactor metagenome]|uniref:Uncharacterized protein n=1 Tax=bioreactor metagenome TaxID=1076179 RepID=A0A645H0H0_9ZZZZ
MTARRRLRACRILLLIPLWDIRTTTRRSRSAAVRWMCSSGGESWMSRETGVRRVILWWSVRIRSSAWSATRMRTASLHSSICCRFPIFSVTRVSATRSWRGRIRRSRRLLLSSCWIMRRSRIIRCGRWMRTPASMWTRWRILFPARWCSRTGSAALRRSLRRSSTVPLTT